MSADPLAEFTKDTFTHGGKTRDVYRSGSGPAVIVIAEIPGITPDVLSFAHRVAGIGCTAVVPHLFGDPGREESGLYTLQSMTFACVSREFTTWALGRTSAVTVWLRGLAAREHERCGGRGVGVVGMCLTGGFALAMMVDEAVVAPVLSQPSLPFAVGAARRRALGISDDDLTKVKARVDDGVCVLGLRFTGDRLVPAERFQRLRDELGDGFVGVEIDSSPGNPHQIGKAAHSVLTSELRDEPGHPTRDALDKVLDLFRSRLFAPSP
jgi:dienelactone hydrolase